MPARKSTRRSAKRVRQLPSRWKEALGHSSPLTLSLHSGLCRVLSGQALRSVFVEQHRCVSSLCLQDETSSAGRRRFQALSAPGRTRHARHVQVKSWPAATQGRMSSVGSNRRTVRHAEPGGQGWRRGRRPVADAPSSSQSPPCKPIRRLWRIATPSRRTRSPFLNLPGADTGRPREPDILALSVPQIVHDQRRRSTHRARQDRPVVAGRWKHSGDEGRCRFNRRNVNAGRASGAPSSQACVEASTLPLALAGA